MRELDALPIAAFDSAGPSPIFTVLYCKPRRGQAPFGPDGVTGRDRGSRSAPSGERGRTGVSTSERAVRPKVADDVHPPPKPLIPPNPSRKKTVPPCPTSPWSIRGGGSRILCPLAIANRVS